MEGLLFKRLDSVYEPGVRGWRKYKVRETTEAIVGAVTGPLSAPRSLLLGRYDDDRRLQYTGRTTTLAQAAGSTVAGLLAPARPGHPWTGWSFSAEWGSRETLNVTLVEPELVVEVGVDVARDASGRWRHAARLHRPRTDLSPHRRPPPGHAAVSGTARRPGRRAHPQAPDPRPHPRRPFRLSLTLNSSQDMAEGAATGMSAPRPHRTAMMTWADAKTL
jgi:hypothetical protein